LHWSEGHGIDWALWRIILIQQGVKSPEGLHICTERSEIHSGYRRA